MIKDLSFSAYIFPVHDGRIAVLKYGENGYGLIGGRLDKGEDFVTALHRELTEELGTKAAKLANIATEIKPPYSFTHTSLERAEKRGALAEEHHFFIATVPEGMQITFCEDRPENISVVWLTPTELTSPVVTPIPDLREFYKQNIIPIIAQAK